MIKYLSLQTSPDFKYIRKLIFFILNYAISKATKIQGTRMINPKTRGNIPVQVKDIN